MRSDVDAALDRLVAQFSSPYDFLRELVQNALDARADRVEVVLQRHSGDTPDEIVLELVVRDSGEGMNAVTLEREFTRLFASGKTGDASMIGGFGVGIASVFAWRPEFVLVHTGRDGEAWELLFHEDRRFEQAALHVPIDGTCVRLFRRGRSGEESSVAEAIRGGLWTWCRFAAAEMTFEDRTVEPVSRVVFGGVDEEVWPLDHVVADLDAHIHVAFGVPAHALLLRGGLVLEEGKPEELLPELANQGAEHLQIRVASSRLRPRMTRDAAVADAGRAEIGRRVAAAVATLREGLVDSVTASLQGGEPDAKAHAWTAWLCAHLELELDRLPKEVLRRGLLRVWGEEAPCSPEAAVAKAAGWPCIARWPKTAEDRDEITQHRAAGRLVLVGGPEDLPWLAAFLRRAGGVVVDGASCLVRVEAMEPSPGWFQPLLAAMETLGWGVKELRPCRGAGADSEPVPAVGWISATDSVGGWMLDEKIVAFDAPTATGLWIRLDHPLADAAGRLADADLRGCLTAWMVAITHTCGQKPVAAAELARAVDAAVERSRRE